MTERNITHMEKCDRWLQEVYTTMADHFLICIWPDYTWCLERDLEEYKWKSDDYKLAVVKCELSDEEIDDLVIKGVL